ncbi:MAG TPA: type II toxin-antitoxin system antitoxin, RelB/DinJ family, partial [Erysipelotrichaceae bacterium]|nr:type II toxin-antitoxin system antitoxin, RelB/DinJ family [Erysipelotrichaceae bacterium]
MSKTANINVRIDPEFKTEVEDLYSSFGMSVTEAINIFLHMSVMEG